MLILEIDGPRFFDPFTNSPYLFIFHWKLFILCDKIVNWGFEFEMKKKKGFVVFWFMVFQLCPIIIKMIRKDIAEHHIFERWLALKFFYFLFEISFLSIFYILWKMTKWKVWDMFKLHQKDHWIVLTVNQFSIFSSKS